ncbi:Pyridoxamine 5'-phosphate oxidase [compost metagenome]
MEAESLHPTEEPIRKLAKMIREVKSFMMTTVDTDGSLRSRPMVVPKQDFEGELWFFSHRSSGKIHAIENDQQVNLSNSSLEDQRHLSLSGRAEAIDDRSKARELWTPILKAWFPEGIGDPNLTLIRVTIDSAEYWESHESTMVRVYNITKSVLTGRQYESKPEDHGKINIQH